MNMYFSSNLLAQRQQYPFLKLTIFTLFYFLLLLFYFFWHIIIASFYVFFDSCFLEITCAFYITPFWGPHLQYPLIDFTFILAPHVCAYCPYMQTREDPCVSATVCSLPHE